MYSLIIGRAPPSVALIARCNLAIFNLIFSVDELITSLTEKMSTLLTDEGNDLFEENTEKDKKC